MRYAPGPSYEWKWLRRKEIVGNQVIRSLGDCRMLRQALVKIEIPQRGAGGLVFGLLERLFELAVEQFRFDLLFVGALAEERFAARGFLLEELRGVVQVRSLFVLGRRLMVQYFTEFGIHTQHRATARANHFEFSGTACRLRHVVTMLRPAGGPVNSGSGPSKKRVEPYTRLTDSSPPPRCATASAS